MSDILPKHRAILLLTVALLFLTFQKGTEVLAQDPDEGTPQAISLHVVQSGETLGQIALQHELSEGLLLYSNNLTSADDIMIGDHLLVPSTAARNYATSIEDVIVDETQSLYTIAASIGVDPGWLGRRLVAVNPLGFYVGQRIRIPAAGAPGQNHNETSIVRLQPDLSLWQVAYQLYMPVAELSQLNSIANAVVAPPGSLVRVPLQDNGDDYSHDPWKDIELHPSQFQAGRSGSLSVTTHEPGVLSANLGEMDLEVVTGDTSHHSVFGLSRWMEPGIYPLTLTFEAESGESLQSAMNILVSSGDYVRESLQIPEDVAAVLNDPQAVEEEAIYVGAIMSGFTPEQYWDGLFQLPAAGVMTSSFGTLRSYNGSGFSTYHAGADLAAPAGTPIVAPANGIVVNTAELEVRGLATMIDHGQGVFTGYWHQSSILVSPGDHVVTGQQIGTIGSTGLSTAAHLHWELWINGIQVDAMQWVREPFP